MTIDTESNHWIKKFAEQYFRSKMVMILTEMQNLPSYKKLKIMLTIKKKNSEEF